MEQIIKVISALGLAFIIMGVSLVLSRKLATWLDNKRKKDITEEEAEDIINDDDQA